MDRPQTAFKCWLLSKKLTYEKAAQRCAYLGRPVSAGYLKNVGEGWNAPSYALAKFLSYKLTKGAVTVLALMDHPYTRSSAGAA